MKNFLPNLALLLFVLAMCAQSHAAPCAIATGACPAYTACLAWDAPTTREGGAPLSASEIKGYELSLNGAPFPLITGTTYSMPVPANKSLRLTDVWSIVTVDTTDLKSVPFACENSVVIAGPRTIPGSPRSFRHVR